MKINRLAKFILNLILIVVISATAVFAQDFKTLNEQTLSSLEAGKYLESIEFANKALAMKLTPFQRHLIVTNRGLALKRAYIGKGLNTLYDFYSAKYSAETLDKLRLAISDNQEVLDYYAKNSPTKDFEIEIRDNSYNQLGDLYLNVAQHSTLDSKDFAEAERYYKLCRAATKCVATDIRPKIVEALAGQGKINEAVALAKQVGQSSVSKYYESYLSDIIDGFDFVGEYYLSEAFILETAGKLKRENQPLKLLQKAISRHRQNQGDALRVKNPNGAIELTRQAAAFYATNQIPKAIPLLNQVLQSSPTNVTALRWRALANMQTNNGAGFEADAAKLFILDSSDASSLSLRGLSLALKGDFDKAQTDLTKAIAAYPELALFYNAYGNLVAVYNQQKKANLANETMVKQQNLSNLLQEAAKGEATKSYTESSDFLDGKPTASSTETDEDEEELTPEEIAALRKKTESLKSNITIGNTPSATVNKTTEFICANIVAGKGCGKIILGMTLKDVTDLLGTAEKTGFNAAGKRQLTYPSKGLRFDFDSNNKAIRIAFDGWTDWNANGNIKSFNGNPDKSLSWKATIQQVQTAYGKPLEKEAWADNNQKAANLTYSNIEFHFRDGQLAVISIF